MLYITSLELIHLALLKLVYFDQYFPNSPTPNPWPLPFYSASVSSIILDSTYEQDHTVFAILCLFFIFPLSIVSQITGFPSFFKAKQHPFIVTFRSLEEEGSYQGIQSPAERSLSSLRTLATLRNDPLLL